MHLLENFKGISIGVWSNFYKAEPSLPKNILTAPDKPAMLTCKIALHHSPHPSPNNLLVKIMDFGHFISLDGMNSIFV